jgi:hypothetical protein
MDRACSTNEKKNAYRMLVGTPEGRRPLVRPRSRWVDNIKMDLRGIGWVDMDWMDLAQNREQWSSLVNNVANLQFSQIFRKFLCSCITGGFSRRAQLHEVS